MELDGIANKIVDGSLENVTGNTTVNMYLIKKHQTKSIENMFGVNTVDITDIAKDFRNIVNKNLADLRTKMNLEGIKYKEFMKVNTPKDDTILMIECTEVKTLTNIYDKIKQRQNLEAVTRYKDVKNIHAYAIELKIGDDRLICFTKYSAKHVISKKFSLTTLFFRGRFNKIKQDVFAFDDYFDCIYDTKSGYVIVLDKTGFEHVFNFKDYYKERTTEALKGLQQSNLIAIDNTLLLKASEKLPFSRKITKLFVNNELNKPLKYFQDHKTQLGTKLNFEIISNKIVIKDEKSLKDFIRVCADDFVEGIVSKKKYVSDIKDEV